MVRVLIEFIDAIKPFIFVRVIDVETTCNLVVLMVLILTTINTEEIAHHLSCSKRC